MQASQTVTTHDTVLYNLITKRLQHGRDTVILVVGEQRNGKTRFVLRMAHEIEGRRFDIRKQFFVNALDFAEAYDTYEGKNLIYDEVGKDLDPFRAMDDINRAVSHVVQSQAYKHNIVWIILPFITDLARPLRKHVRAAVEVTGRGQYRLLRPYVKHADFNDSRIKCEEIECVAGVPMPPAHIEKIYSEEIEVDTKKDIMKQELTRIRQHAAKKAGQAQAAPAW